MTPYTNQLLTEYWNIYRPNALVLPKGFSPRAIAGLRADIFQ